MGGSYWYWGQRNAGTYMGEEEGREVTSVIGRDDGRGRG